MAGITGMFSIGRLALFANQKGLEVTSQNIANVNTEGYTRQEVVLETTHPVTTAPGQIGTGVEAVEVRRVVNTFFERQITAGASDFGRLHAREGLLSQIELSFTDADGTGTSLAFSDFFSAIHDLSTNPQDRAARAQLLERAKQLSAQIVTMDAQLRQIQTHANDDVAAVLGEINQFASQVAALNGQIKQATLVDQNPNDLMDKRQNLINQISERIGIQTIEDNTGQVTIFTGNGRALVEGMHARSLVGVPSADKGGLLDISFNAGGGAVTDMTSDISNGRLSSLMDVRDNEIPRYLDSLDRLAAATVNVVNQQHRAGYGLDGSTGNDLFGPLVPSAMGLGANTGTGALGVTIADASVLTLDQYDVTLSGGNYTITNRSTGAASAPGTLPQTFEGLTVALSSGVPANGDVFRISAHQGAAGRMSVSLTNPDQVAAASTAAGAPGDNRNANLMAAIQNQVVSALGGDTLQAFYGGLVGDVGANAQTVQRGLTVETEIRSQLQNMRQETSGVSLDEEMTNIIKFQRAYEAAAKLISTADELFQTILAMK
ncbi:MAG: flagellar hook-associated protein FlgK [Nitrospiria bacterium]